MQKCDWCKNLSKTLNNTTVYLIEIPVNEYKEQWFCKIINGFGIRWIALMKIQERMVYKIIEKIHKEINFT